MAASAQGIKAGGAYVSIGTDTLPLVRGLNQAEARVKAFAATVGKIGGSFKNLGSTVSGLGQRFAAIGAAASVPLLGAVKSAADLNETLSKTKTVLGDSAQTIIGQADMMAERFGVAKREYIDAATAFASVFKGLGKSQAEAADLGNQLATLGMDLASFNNTSNEEAFAAISSALRGEFDPIEKYLVFLSAAKIETKALEMGLAKTKGELTDQAKKTATLALITSQAADAVGDLERTAGSLGNQAKSIQGRLANLAVDVGTALVPVVSEVTTRIGDAVKRVSEWAQANPGLVKAIAATVAGVTALGAGLLVVGPAIGAIGTAFSLAAAAVGAVGTAIGALSATLALVATPLGAITVAVVAAIAALTDWQGLAKRTGKSVGSAFSQMKGTAIESFKAIVDALNSGDTEGALKILSAAIKVEWITLVDTLKKIWSDFIEEISRPVDDLLISVGLMETQLGTHEMGKSKKPTGSPELQAAQKELSSAIGASRQKVQAAAAVPSFTTPAGQFVGPPKPAVPTPQFRQLDLRSGSAVAELGSVGPVTRARILESRRKRREAEAGPKAPSPTNVNLLGLAGGVGAGVGAEVAKVGKEFTDFKPMFDDIMSGMEGARTEVKGGFGAVDSRALGIGDTRPELQEAKKQSSLLERIAENTDLSSIRNINR